LLESVEDDEIFLTGWVADLVHGGKGKGLKCYLPQGQEARNPNCLDINQSVQGFCKYYNNQSVQGFCKYYKDV